MRDKGLLAAFLMGLGLCFAPVLGHTEISGKLIQGHVKARLGFEASLLDSILLEARVNYIMNNAPNHEWVWIKYDMDGSVGKFWELPENVNTTGKIVILIQDLREYYAPKLFFTNRPVLELFEGQLTVIYGYIEDCATDMDNDIAALVRSNDGVPLAYFYQGEYHLWEE